MGLSLPHILILAVVVLLLFGGGRFSNMMGDVAKGIKSFKKGMAEEDEPAHTAPPAAPRLQQQPPIEPNSDPSLQPMKDDRPHS